MTSPCVRPLGEFQEPSSPVSTFYWAQVLLEVVGPPLDPVGADAAPPQLTAIDGRPMAPPSWSPEPCASSAQWPHLQATTSVEPRQASPQAYVTEVVGFDSYVRSHSPALLRLAYLLAGDHHRAKDLVQATLTKMLPRWDRVADRGDPHAYVRTVMLHTALGWRRRKWEAERPIGDFPDRPANRDPAAAVDDRERLRRALLRLPPRQRAAVVLRHYEDLSEAQAAAAMGCSVGTVKTHTARGLDQLRVLLTDA